jgi:hypothetical protein
MCHYMRVLGAIFEFPRLHEANSEGGKDPAAHVGFPP